MEDDLKHLWITGGNKGMIFFKLNIPVDLRHHFTTKDGKPKDRIVESTGTDSRTQARLFRDQRLGYWRATFEHLRRGGKLGETLPMQLVPFAPAMEAMGMRSASRRESMPAEEPHQERPEPDFLSELDRLLARSGGSLPPQAQALAQELARTVAAARYGLAPETLPAAPAAAPGGETFSQALDAYLNWLQDERKAPGTTVRDFRTRGMKFVKHAGDPLIAAITYDIAKDFVDHIAKTMGNGNAANKARSLCHTVIEYARERRKFKADHQNPFKFRGRKHKAHPHDKFKADDLRALFRSETFTKRETKPKKYDVASALPWVAAIALYTGARGEEIVQLRREDLRQENGIWIFDITPEASARGELKNESSPRKTPVHSALIELGLLDYHKALPKNAERLFPNLPMNKYGRYWTAVGKAFACWRKRKDVGVHRAGEKLDFHSFRHTFTQKCEAIGVAENDADKLTGHGHERISYGLYSGPEVERLKDVIERVKFEV
jgi:integrase